MQPMFDPLSAPPEEPPPRPPIGTRPPDDKAVAAVVLGFLSVAGTLCWMGLPLGVPAIALGAMAHRDIRRSGGTTRGHRLATAGIVLGSIGSTLFLGWVAVVALAVVQGSLPFGLSPGSATRPPPAPTTATPDPGVGGSPAPTEVTTANFVDLHASTGPLRAQLATQASAALRVGDTLLVQTTARGCAPCSEVTLAIADAQVQAVLPKVRIVRLDIGEFDAQLKALRMNEPAAPWFYLIDARGQPRDAISADEWDDNDPGNIAPVLGAFVRGKLRARRASWRGETSL
jgi:hypothetical protein